jgi:hypothetical protein
VFLACPSYIVRPCFKIKYINPKDRSLNNKIKNKGTFTHPQMFMDPCCEQGFGIELLRYM